VFDALSFTVTNLPDTSIPQIDTKSHVWIGIAIAESDCAVEQPAGHKIYVPVLMIKITIHVKTVSRSVIKSMVIFRKILVDRVTMFDRFLA
jgi:hypothetical protein